MFVFFLCKRKPFLLRHLCFVVLLAFLFADSFLLASPQPQDRDSDRPAPAERPSPEDRPAPSEPTRQPAQEESRERESSTDRDASPKPTAPPPKNASSKGNASVDKADVAKTSSSSYQTALKLFQQGISQFENGYYFQAIEHFLAAHKLFPSPKIYTRVALSYRWLANYVKAIEYYELFLQEFKPSSGNNADIQLIKQVKSELPSLLKNVAQLKVEFKTPVGAELRINGRLAGVAPLEQVFRLEPGSVSVAAAYKGYITMTRNIGIATGEIIEISIALTSDEEMRKRRDKELLETQKKAATEALRLLRKEEEEVALVKIKAKKEEEARLYWLANKKEQQRAAIAAASANGRVLRATGVTTILLGISSLALVGVASWFLVKSVDDLKEWDRGFEGRFWTGELDETVRTMRTSRDAIVGLSIGGGTLLVLGSILHILGARQRRLAIKSVEREFSLMPIITGGNSGLVFQGTF